MDDKSKVFEFGKVKIAFFLLFIAGILTAIGNTIQTHVKEGLHPVSFGQSLTGAMVIFGVAMVGYVISQLPYLKKLSPVFWVGIIGVIMSSPIFPGHDFIASQSKVIQFAALGTPTLAFAGLALGKDLPILRRLSWKIVLVGLAVILGSVLLAAIISEFLLRMEGII
ncbi:hypothetical protein [Brevibacillus sp. SYSU BS000544]|uniref:hypothetical protein n=1 Tax=Brevibacillus sp. SYSU BS000544 TaxID=3416443 RepID=UPI003CE4C6E7